MSQPGRHVCSLRGQVGSWGCRIAGRPCLAPGPEFNPQIHRRKATGTHRAGSSLEQKSEWELGPALTKLEGLDPSRAGSPTVQLERLGKEAAEWHERGRMGWGGGGVWLTMVPPVCELGDGKDWWDRVNLVLDLR